MIDQSIAPRLATHIRTKNWFLIRTIWLHIKDKQDLERLEQLRIKLPIGLIIKRNKSGLAFYEDNELVAEIRI